MNALENKIFNVIQKTIKKISISKCYRLCYIMKCVQPLMADMLSMSVTPLTLVSR